MKFLLTIKVEGQRVPGPGLGPVSLKEPAVLRSGKDPRTTVTASWHLRVRAYNSCSLLGVSCTGHDLTWNFFLATKYCMRLITLMVARWCSRSLWRRRSSMSSFHDGNPLTHAKGTPAKRGWTLQEQGEHSIQSLPCL